MSKPLIAIVGRPNVGKSMLFNKLIGRRLSIVEDTPGVTRDRIYGECEWNGRKFPLVDTGGIEPDTDNEILAVHAASRRRSPSTPPTSSSWSPISSTGVTAADQDVAGHAASAQEARGAGGQQDATPPARSTRTSMSSTIWVWATPSPFPPSTATAPATCWMPCLAHTFPRRTRRKMTAMSFRWPSSASPMWASPPCINRILGEQRVIVSNMAGTTRDAIDSYFENETGKYILHRHRRYAEKVQGGRQHRKIQCPAGHHGH